MYDFKEEIGKKFYEAQNSLPNKNKGALPTSWDGLSEKSRNFHRQAGAIVAQAVENGKLPDRLIAAVKEKNQAYAERSKILAVFSQTSFHAGICS